MLERLKRQERQEPSGTHLFLVAKDRPMRKFATLASTELQRMARMLLVVPMRTLTTNSASSSRICL